MKERRRARGEAEMEAVLGNTDLLPQILVCVPAKSLIRFKGVSKSWFSIISDAQFCIDHTTHNFGKNVSELILQTSVQPQYPRPKKERIFYFPLDSHHNLITPASINCSKSLNIIHSCNGLFLCRNFVKNHFVVYNFTTQNHKIIPQPPSGHYNDSWDGNMALAFFPSKSCHYKVVLFRPCIPQPKIDIFSSESGSWKELCVADLHSPATSLVSWNGAIHWIADGNYHIEFQIDHEKLIPNLITVGNLSQDDCIRYFGADDHSLLLLIRPYRASSETCAVLEMNKNSSCWALKYQVDFSQKYFSVLYIKSEAKDEHSTVVLAVPLKIISYHLVIEKHEENLNIARGEVREYKSNYLEFMDHSFHPVIHCLAPV